MKRFQVLLILGLLVVGSQIASAKKINVLVVTGGHDFDRESFFAMFDSFPGIQYTELKHPTALDEIGKLAPRAFDAVVFYDMPKTISNEGIDAFKRLLQEGKGLVFLHHALASYQGWDDYKYIIGGKYHEEPNTPQSSSYQHDVRFTVKIADPGNPVTKGVNDFEIRDEVYGNTEVLPDVTPILFTDHPLSSKIIGWTHRKENSQIVYIEPGHDQSAYNNSTYRKLVKQAIGYVSAGK